MTICIINLLFTFFNADYVQQERSDFTDERYGSVISQLGSEARTELLQSNPDLIFGNPNLLKPAHLNKKKRKTGEGKENSTIKKNKQQLINETASNSSAHDTNFQASILQNQPSFICSDLSSYNNIRNSTISIQPINNQNDHFHNNSQSFMPNSS